MNPCARKEGRTRMVGGGRNGGRRRRWTAGLCLKDPAAWASPLAGDERWRAEEAEDRGERPSK